MGQITTDGPRSGGGAAATIGDLIPTVTYTGGTINISSSFCHFVQSGSNVMCIFGANLNSGESNLGPGDFHFAIPDTIIPAAGSLTNKGNAMVMQALAGAGLTQASPVDTSTPDLVVTNPIGAISIGGAYYIYGSVTFPV